MTLPPFPVTLVSPLPMLAEAVLVDFDRHRFDAVMTANEENVLGQSDDDGEDPDDAPDDEDDDDDEDEDEDEEEDDEFGDLTD